ncbi:hypothetical protein A5712_05295, partial [Mycobacterium sp. E2327]|uniref:PE family protein n=1 Tax=Mycobacterium sp. E2327 TaxID=1834132 RepID=UPI0007FE3793
MSHVTATPHLLAAAAGDLASVGSTINAANSTAAAGTAGVEAPGGDAVSAFVSALFSAHSKAYQAAGAQAAYYHDQFVQALRASAGTYASTEAVNASPLQKVQEFVGAASQSPAGHLIGNAAHGAMDAAQHAGSGGPVPGSVGTAPVSANHVGAGAGASTGDGRVAAAGGPPGGNAGGGGAVAGDGGGMAADAVQPRQHRRGRVGSRHDVGRWRRRRDARHQRRGGRSRAMARSRITPTATKLQCPCPSRRYV